MFKTCVIFVILLKCKLNSEICIYLLEPCRPPNPTPVRDVTEYFGWDIQPLKFFYVKKISPQIPINRRTISPMFPRVDFGRDIPLLYNSLERRFHFIKQKFLILAMYISQSKNKKHRFDQLENYLTSCNCIFQFYYNTTINFIFITSIFILHKMQTPRMMFRYSRLFGECMSINPAKNKIFHIFCFLYTTQHMTRKFFKIVWCTFIRPIV